MAKDLFGGLGPLSLNTPPSLVADTGLTLDAGGPATITAAMLDVHDAEQSDNQLVYAVTTLPAHGRLLLNGVTLGLGGDFSQDDIDNNRVSYVQDGSAAPSDSFGFSISDGDNGLVTGQTFAFTIEPANVAPTVSATGANVTAIEHGPAVQLFSDAAVSTVEAGQSIIGIFINVNHVGQGESLFIDGTTVALQSDTIVTTAGHGLVVNIGNFTTGTSASVQISSATGISAADTEQIIDTLAFADAGPASSTAAHGLSLAITDSGGTAGGGVATSTNSIQATVQVTAVNDPPGLSATALDPAFTEGGAAAGVFANASAATTEVTQSVIGLTLTVSNVTDGAAESLVIDGSTLALTDGCSLTTLHNGLAASVVLTGTTATVTLAGPAGLSLSAANSVVNSIQYANGSDDPTAGDRIIMLTAIQDNGGTANGGHDTTSLDIESTVHVVPVNDAPTLSATATPITVLEGGPAVQMFSNAAVSTVEAGQDITSFSISINHVTRGESLAIDGTTVSLDRDTDYTSVGHGLIIDVETGTTTSISVTSLDGLSAADVEQIVDTLAFSDAGPSPVAVPRTITVHDLTDNGGTANGGADLSLGRISSTIQVTPVNDAPVLSATALSPTFTEGGMAAGLFGNAAASTTDTSQSLIGLTLTVSGVTNGAAETLSIDGSSLALTDGNSLTTLTNGLTASVALSGTTATVTLGSAAGLISSAMDSVVDSIQYANGSDDPAGGDRVIALTAIQDNGGTTNGGRDTTSLDIESTVHVVPVNDAPTLSATGTTVTAIEQGAAVVLFSNAAVSTIESGQTVTGLQIQVSNAGDTLSESLTIDGSQVGLRAGNSVTTADHGMTAAVTYSSGIATVTLSSPSGVSATAIQDIVDGMTYSDATPTSTGLDRTVTLHAITDNGGAANDGIDTTSLSIATTVHIALVNDAPTLLAIPADPTFTEGQDPGGPIFAGALADAVESNQLLPRLTLTVSNVTDGPAESLGIDGSTLALTDGNSLVTAGHGAMAAVSLDGTTATVTLSDVTGLSASAMSSLIAGLTYSNSSDNPSAAGRTVTLTSLQDNGGTANGGHDAGSFDIASTVQVVPVDDPAVAHNDVFTTDEASAIGHGSSVFADNGSGIDSDVDGPALQVAAVNGDAAAVGEEITLASGAHLTLNADGTFAYDPDHAFDYLAAPGSGASDTAATDSFTYTLANGGTAIATVAISGIDGNDLVQGTAGADLLSAGAGDDVIMAGGGNDTINGGRGTDTAVYSGAHGDYTVTFDAGSQSFTVADNRAGSPDGTDTLTHVETFRFSDGQFDYDPAGHLVSQTIANGDGSTATTLFDAEGQSPWAAQVIATDAAGSIASQTIDLDNGGKWVNTYDTTNASAELWDSQQFDVNGQLIERTVTQDDGTHTLTINDVADSYAWSTATISFDAKWNMTAFSGVNDDGTATETMAAIGPALDTMLWFATPYDANQGMATGIALTGGANIDVLYGHAGDDVLSGGGGDDVIAGGRGNDTLSGGLGDDHFAFTDGDGNDTVTDFSSGDVIALHAYDISDFAALLLHMEQSGGDTVITFDPENSITLHGVMPSQLHAEDFLFV